MPYININGQLTEVSQAEFNAYNTGTSTNPAGGGTITQLNNTQEILNPNTTNNIPGNRLPSLSEQIAAAGLSPPASQLSAADQANIDALNRIDANRANPQPDNSPGTLSEQIRAAGLSPAPSQLSAEDQATIDALNRIESRKANNVGSETFPTQQENIASIRAATTTPTPFDPAQDEFGNLDSAQAAAADSATPVTQEDINAGLDEALAAQGEEEDNAPRIYNPKDLGVEEDGWLSQKFGEAKSFFNRATLASEETAAGITQAATLQRAKEQATLAARFKKPAMGDWRVRLVLAEGSDYLYNAGNPGILKPLANSNGVIFPYTPAIATNYAANYDKYELMHSNFRGYFYKNSTVGDITITATFTAQDTQEASYMLAVIHFFRSVTKMFYGKDAERGAPPPMVYLVGLGDFQFNGHPCLVSNFAYNLPADVDYIRAGTPNNQGTNLADTNNATTNNTATSSVLSRLKNAFLPRGALPQIPAIDKLLGSVNNISGATYVPTKIEITITLLPVNTRSQVSQQFSLKGFANGDLLKGGFW